MCDFSAQKKAHSTILSITSGLFLTILYFHLSLTLVPVSSYWFSNNRLTWQNASRYCQYRCNSHLASFHNPNAYTSATRLIQNSMNITMGFNDNQKDIWIGLKRNSPFKGWEWSDNSTFDFGSNTSSTGSPWAPDTHGPSNHNQNCVRIWIDADYKWKNRGCSSELRFLCNSCEAKLDKYILYRQTPQSDTANHFCRNFLGTALASVHTNDDVASAVSLAALSGIDTFIWIYDPTNTSYVQPPGHATCAKYYLQIHRGVIGHGNIYIVVQTIL